MQPMGFAENQIKISKILPKPPIRLNDVPTGVTYCPRPQLHLIKLLIPLHSEPWFPLSYHHILFPLLGTTPPRPHLMALHTLQAPLTQCSLLGKPSPALTTPTASSVSRSPMGPSPSQTMSLLKARTLLVIGTGQAHNRCPINAC